MAEPDVHGYCDDRFAAVAEAFAENFRSRRELGASVALTIEGEKVVDLWGGHKTRDGDAWTEDTICVVFSSTKGATALCAHILIDRGLMVPETPVAEIWPEFATGGKEAVTVAMMLDHSAGVPAFREPLPENAIYDWDYMVARLAAEAPHWPPGTRHGYHGLTFGWTVGELVRRVSGKSLGAFFQDEIAQPLELEFWIGTPAAQHHRVSPVITERHPAGEALPPFLQAALKQKGSIASLFLRDSAGGLNSGYNTPEGLQAEIGAANGVTNGRGLAGMYAPLANGGGPLVSAETVARMSRVSTANHQDATLVIPTRFALGFMKAMDNRALGHESALIGESAFGHVGAGGSIGFADPAKRMSFGYVMNRKGLGLLLNERGQSLVDAAYDVVS